jgi:hypothetical protein
MVASDRQSLNPRSPIDWSDDGSVTEARRVQLTKAFTPVDFKPFSIATVLSDLQF